MLNKISIKDVITVHSRILQAHGGALGILNFGLLDSAVNRMHASFDGQDLYGSIFEKAAALFQSLCKNHCFLDGNKRTSVAATVLFLRRNNVELCFDEMRMEEFVIEVASSDVAFERIAEFFKQHAK